MYLSFWRNQFIKYEEYKNNLINIIEKSNSCENGDIYLFAVFYTDTDEFEIGKYVRGESKDLEPIWFSFTQKIR